MVASSNAAEYQNVTAITAIHINTLRLLISCLIPMAAKNARDPDAWIGEIKALALQSADYASFEAVGAISQDLMKAAVIGALEEILGAASRTLNAASV